ncbi:MAG: hypothetical protein IPJ74_01195 [Saprospiraceae bacterium]|nr:hypothetical protein [Saprospiraceae bacterium]
MGYTVWQLIAAPGKAIREYLFEDRSRMMRRSTWFYWW